jgi:TRAP-type C4-dicarboxylate transport system permease small subunit
LPALGGQGVGPAWHTAMLRLARWIEQLSRFFGAVAVALIVAAVAVICQLLIVRFILGQSAIWQNEFVTFALIAATFLGAPYVLLTRGHVNVDLVPLFLKGRARRWLSLLASGLGLAFCLAVLGTSLEWWWEAFVNDFRTSTVWRARLWIPYASLPVGMTLLCLQYLVEIWSVATGREPPFGMAHTDAGSKSPPGMDDRLMGDGP